MKKNYTTPSEIRALNAAMEQYSNEHGADRKAKKNSPESLLRSYSFIHDNIRPFIYELADKSIGKQANEPLTSVELTSFNNWFWLHPEKVAGDTEITSSLHFPLTIKGDKEDVVKVLENGLKSAAADINDIELLELEAEAEIEILELLDIK